MSPRRVVIVGAVAGGASCATRLRRLDESAEISLFERGPHASFANCGLPYRLGEVITSDDALLVASAGVLRDRFQLEVHTRHNVLAIDRAAREILVEDIDRGEQRRVPYDALVLSPGAVPIRPPLPGIELPGIFTLRNIPDMAAIRDWIRTRNVRRAIIVGAGFIGLETAENLRQLGLDVTMIEMLDQIMPPLDPEMVRPVEAHLSAHGVTLALGDGVAAFTFENGGKILVQTVSGAVHPGDLVILAIGVRPDVTLARQAGLEVGESGGIRVNPQMQTSDPNIYAVGDAVEVTDRITGLPMVLALAGPANRQGRIAADAIAGRESGFDGVIGTSVCGVFDMALGSTGVSEKRLKRLGIEDFQAIYLHPAHHAGYYPGAELLHIKLLFRRSDRRLLGAQVTGTKDVARKLDTFAAFLHMEATIDDLAEAELAYAPQFGSAKDAVNLAGMISANILDGLSPVAPDLRGWLLDVREADEFAAGHVDGATNIPLGSLRSRLNEIPRDKPVNVYCQSGKRAYDAQRILVQHGIDARQVSGGWLTIAST